MPVALGCFPTQSLIPTHSSSYLPAASSSIGTPNPRQESLATNEIPSYMRKTYCPTTHMKLPFSGLPVLGIGVVHKQRTHTMSRLGCTQMICRALCQTY